LFNVTRLAPFPTQSWRFTEIQKAEEVKESNLWQALGGEKEDAGRMVKSHVS
jgi:hypothetical protein